MRTQPFEVEKIEIRFSDSPQSLFTVNRMFSRWPMTTISALLFAFRGLGRGCSSSSRYQTRSLLLWIDLRRHGTLNVASRHPSTLLRPQEVNLKEEFGSQLLDNHRKFTQFLLVRILRGIKSFSFFFFCIRKAKRIFVNSNEIQPFVDFKVYKNYPLFRGNNNRSKFI